MSLLTHKAVLVILTNASQISKQHPSTTNHHSHTPTGDELTYTGFDIHEVAHAWLHFHKKMNVKMVFASPKGGEAPIDPRSMREAERDEAVADLLSDRYLNDIFRNTQNLDHIRPEEYCLVLIPGCHGAMMDLPSHPRVAQVLQHIYYQEKGIVATIGHGSAALLSLDKSPSSSEPFVKGRRLTGTTNEEEKKKGSLPLLPFLLEDKLRACGAQFEAKGPFESFVIADERLITAQNTFSVSDWIQKIIETIQKSKPSSTTRIPS